VCGEVPSAEGEEKWALRRAEAGQHDAISISLTEITSNLTSSFIYLFTYTPRNY
jgi:hypothetical protein